MRLCHSGLSRSTLSVVVLFAPASVMRLCFSACDAAWRLFTQWMTGVHHLFNLLAPLVSLFFSSLHCSLWFIQSPLPASRCLPSLSLALALYSSSLDWDSMYPEKVRTLSNSAFDGTMIYFSCASSLCVPLQLSICPWPSSLGHFCFHLPESFLPVTFYLVTFKLTAQTFLIAFICMMLCRARVGVLVWDLFSK